MTLQLCSRNRDLSAARKVPEISPRITKKSCYDLNAVLSEVVAQGPLADAEKCCGFFLSTPDFLEAAQDRLAGERAEVLVEIEGRQIGIAGWRAFQTGKVLQANGLSGAQGDGDTIQIDTEKRRLDVAEDLDPRSKDWKPPRTRYETGVMAKYARLVSSASEGAVTGF